MAARPMPSFVPAVSYPAVIQPRPIPFSGPDDDELWELTPQNVADSLAVFGYAFAPTTDAQRAADAWGLWMRWKSDIGWTKVDDEWEPSVASYCKELVLAMDEFVRRAGPYVMRERTLFEASAFCERADSTGLDELTGWLSGAQSSAPLGTPPRLTEAAKEGWRMFSCSTLIFTIWPMTKGEWRRASNLSTTQVQPYGAPENDIRPHAAEVISLEVKRRLNSLQHAVSIREIPRL